MVLLDFSDSDDNFQVSDEEINIGISLKKGNTELKDAIDGVLATMTTEDYEQMMQEAIQRPADHSRIILKGNKNV